MYRDFGVNPVNLTKPSQGLWEGSLRLLIGRWQWG